MSSNIVESTFHSVHDGDESLGRTPDAMTTITPPEVSEISETGREQLYHVIILNDDEHTYDYVVEMLQSVFGLDFAAALAHTMEADSTGSSIVMTCGLTEAEKKRDQVHAYGPDWRLPHSRGSVTALIEPAE